MMLQVLANGYADLPINEVGPGTHCAQAIPEDGYALVNRSRRRPIGDLCDDANGCAAAEVFGEP